MRVILGALVALVMMIGSARAENPDGPKGTTWLDFGGSTSVSGKWTIEQKVYVNSPAFSNGAGSTGAHFGYGFVAGPRLTIMAGLSYSNTVIRNADLSGSNINQTTRFFEAGATVRVYLSGGK